MTTNTTPDRNNTGKTKTLMFYSLFMVGMLIALIPFWQAAAASCIILCFVFLTAYSIRRKETLHSIVTTLISLFVPAGSQRSYH
jgi:hypothetical protein